MKYILPLILLISFIDLLHGQKTAPLVNDCFDAAIIKAIGKFTFEESPQGVGVKLEFSGNSSKSLHYFEKENNSAWFQFDAVSDGMLTFKVFPKDTAADFDFLLFRYTDENFCSEIKRRKIKPLRSNISRYKPEEKSITGLSTGADNEFVHSGPGNNFSSAISVKKGERYYLVLDNVYGNTSGFKLAFSYYKNVEISGFVKDEEGNTVKEEVDVTWESKTGEILAKTVSNKETGKYNFDVPVRIGGKPLEYTLSAFSSKYFFFERIIKADKNFDPKPINVVLPKLKKGKNVILKNINFFGNSPKPLPTAKSSFKRLYKLMKSNDSLQIRIDGHTNGCNDGVAFSQKLSQDRAKTVKMYLIEKGISEGRISTKGFNCSQMLFPENGTSEQQKLNRRVEILVTHH